MISPGFWKGKRVFMTGHTGFKGSWLSLWLQQLGANVIGYSLPAPTEPNLFGAARVSDGMESLSGDVRDLDALTSALSARTPDIVLHLAAQSLVRESYRDPVGTYATNVMGTVHLLEAARSVPSVRAVVVVSSDKCYENREWLWGYRENEALGGYDAYSSSKGCAEIATAAYRRSFFAADAAASRTGLAAVASARAGNVIGGGDWAADRLVPDMIRGFTSGRPVRIRNPEAIRPWQHVLEPLCGYLMLAERLWDDTGEFANAWNFGPDDSDARTVRSVADGLVARWGEGASWCEDSGEHPHEATSLKLDSAKARRRLSWRPRLDLDTALSWVADWYRADSIGGDVRAVTLEQITAYQREGA